MTRSSLAAVRRLVAPVLLGTLLGASAGHADTLYMKIDGVPGEGAANQPLGPDAFTLLTFSVSVEDPSAPATSSAATVKPGARDSLADVRFDMRVSPAAIAMWQIAAQRAVKPKATFVSVDEAGKVRFRVDLEDVTVKTFGIQTLGGRDAGTGMLDYRRIRMTYGEGKQAITAGWDRDKEQPWK